MEKQTLGKKICELRKSKNLTQLELAEMLNITDKAVSKWERDVSCPDINTFPKLAEILGVSTDELLRASTSKEEKEKDGFSVDLVLKAIPLALSIGVMVLATIDQINWEDAVSLLGIAVLSLTILEFRKDKKQ